MCSSIEHNVIFTWICLSQKSRSDSFAVSPPIFLETCSNQYASDEAERRKLAQAQIKFCTVNDRISTYTYTISFKHPFMDPVLPTGLSV